MSIKVMAETTMDIERGMVFKLWSTNYLLVQCSGDTFTLISLTNGNRWCEPVSIDVLEKIIQDEGFTYVNRFGLAYEFRG